MTRRAVVVGTGHYLPQRVVENAEFEASLETSDEWIRSRSGIERRHFAAEGETTSDMATEAALDALKDAGLEASDIDAIVLATSTADLTFPSAATMVQAKLGMTSGFAFDVQAVCAGFVYALTNANALIVSGQANRVLVIGSETFSRIMDWTDRSTCVLFGDGAGALVLEAQDQPGDTDDRGILSTDLNSDGRYKDLLYNKVTIPDFGTFKVAFRAARSGTHPSEQKTVQIDETFVITFHPGKALKQAFKKGSTKGIDAALKTAQKAHKMKENIRAFKSKKK